MTNEQQPFFSVIIPTRNRADLFKLALDSVLMQKFDSYEVIVVNDGSSPEQEKAYKETVYEHSNVVTLYSLVCRINGHGPSFSRNFGVQMAKGKYLCFLDDDDQWVDENHLQRAYDSILNSKHVDAYLCNQKAYHPDGKVAEGNIWIEDLISKAEGYTRDKNDTILVTEKLLLQSPGFCHLNCTIINKVFYTSIKGMDENIRYEEDRDFYLRVIDRADNILYNPKFIARHNIPNRNKAKNASTMILECEKLLYQLRIYDKGVIFAKTDSIYRLCLKHKSYTLKKISESLFRERKYKKSRDFALQALGVKFSIKFFIFAMYLVMLSLLDFKTKSKNAEE